MKSWGIPPRRHPLVCVLYSEWKSHAAWQHDHVTGWWFQTCLISHNIWDNTSHWLILFKMVKTTNQMMSILLVQLCLLVGSMIVDVGSLRRKAQHLNPRWEHNPEIPISIHFTLGPKVIQFSNFQTWDLLGLWRLQNDLSWIQSQLMGLPSWQICCTW